MASLTPPGGPDGFFLDCSTLSISYQPNGLASISMTLYSLTGSDLPYGPGGPGFNLIAGGVQFKGFILEQSLAPNSELDSAWVEYHVSVIALGKKV